MAVPSTQAARDQISSSCSIFLKISFNANFHAYLLANCSNQPFVDTVIIMFSYFVRFNFCF